MATVSRLQIVLEATTTAFDRGLRSATNTLQGFQRQVGQLHDRMDRFARRHRDALNGLQTAGQSATVGLGAIAVAIKGAVDEAMRFEDAMAEVKKVIDFDTPDGVTEFRNELEKLSGQLPIAFDGLAKIAAAAGQSGIATEDILRFTTAAAKMGTAFDISAEEAGQAMAEMRVAFKMSQSEVETLADKINYLGNTTPNTAAKIMEVVQRIGSLGGIAGVSSDQIAALAGSITAVEPEVAATGIKNMMLALTKGESATKGQRKAFEALGLSATKVAKKMQQDSMGALFEVIGAIKKLPKETQVAMTNSIFGAEALPVISQLIENTDNLTGNLQAVGDASKYAGSMNKEYEARAATLSNTLAILKNKLTNTKAAIGEAFTPYIADLADKFSPVMDKINEWVKTNPDLIATIAAVSAGVLGLIAGLGTLALAFTAITGGLGAIISIGTMIGAMFAGISSAISVVGMFGSALAALGFPVTAVVAGIAAIVAGGVLLYQNWDEVKVKASELWNNLPQIFADGWQAIKTYFAEIGKWFDGVWEDVGTVIGEKINDIKQTIKAWLAAMPQPVQDMVANVIAIFNGLKTSVLFVWEGLATIAKAISKQMSEAWQNFIDDWASLWGELKTSASKAWSDVVKVVAPAIKSMIAAVKAGFALLVELWKTEFVALKTAVVVTFEAIKAISSFGMNAIKSIFVAGLTAAASVFNAGFSLIKNAFTTAFAVIKALVRGDMQGVVKAIGAGLASAVSIIRTMLQNIVVAFNSLGGQLLQAGREAMQGFINGVKGKMSEALAAAKQMAQQVASTVKSALDIHSPSRVMKKLGKHTADGFAKGIKKNANKAVKAAQKMAQNAKRAVIEEVASLKRDIFLLSDDTPIRALRYDINQGKYGRNNTQELERLTRQKYEMEQTKSVLDEIMNIRKEMVFSRLTLVEQLNWEIANTSKYNGVNAQALHALRLQTHEKQKFLALQEQSSRIEQANNQSRQNYLDLEKRIALFGNQSKLAEFDYDWQHGQYKDADNMLILRERAKIAELERLEQQANARDNFDNLTKELAGEESPLEQLKTQLGERLMVIEEYERTHINVEQQAQTARLKAQQIFEQARTDLSLSHIETNLNLAGGFVRSLFGEQSRAYRLIFALEKGMAIARIILANKTALAQAWASAPFPANLGAVAKVAVESGALVSAVNAIKPVIGQAHDGIMSVPKSGTWNLEKGERVLPKHTAQNLDNTLDRLQGGGSSQVINISVTVNNDGGDVQSSHNLGKNLGNAIKLVVQSELQKEKRQGGLLYGR